MNQRHFLFLCLFVTAPLARGEDLTLAEATRLALRNNPTIKAAHARWEAVKARVPQAAAWEDVKVGAVSRVARFIDVPPDSFTDQTLSVEQMIPLSGKNRSRSRIASAEALAAFAEMRRKELDVVAKVRASYFRLSGTAARLELNRVSETSLEQAIGIARVRLSVGGQTQVAVLAAENELTKLRETRRDLELGVSTAETQLQVLMNRDAFAPLGRLARSAVLPPPPALPELRGELFANRPELRLAEATILSAQARLELARREWIPDPTVSVAAQRYNAAAQVASEVTAGVSINLPWLNRKKYRAEIAEAEHEVEAAQRALEAARGEALGLLHDQLAKIETLHHHEELVRASLIPTARQAVEVNRVAYESDKIPFADLIVVIREENEFQALLLGHETDYRIALAELDALVGRLAAAPGKLIPAKSSKKK